MTRLSLRRTPPLAILLTLLTLTAGAAAQHRDQETLRALLEKKQQAEFFEVADWATDLAMAKQRAEQSRKLIFAYFTRSYAP